MNIIILSNLIKTIKNVNIKWNEYNKEISLSVVYSGLQFGNPWCKKNLAKLPEKNK